MDPLHRTSGHESPTVTSAGPQTPSKRPLPSRDEPSTKKIRPSVEVPAVYSDAVRKKLASTTRTGQACDRCKERKMKCDTNPTACQPCRQKNLRCYTTDRVTGQPRERGQTDRAENELQTLREQNAAYQRRYGPLDEGNYGTVPYSPVQESSKEQSQHPQPPPERDKSDGESSISFPDAQYIGWPAPSHIESLRSGPVNGGHVDILDGVIDIADFPCEVMDEYPTSTLNVYNMSRTSVMNTLTGYQNITDPRFPSKEQALSDANTFLLILSQYVPILHSVSFLRMVERIYDQPGTVSQSEHVQLAVVLAIVEHQMGVRNPRESAEKFKQSHYHIHYALTYYRELLREPTLASMQALALILVHFRNLPKPGYTWGFGHSILVKAMEAEYHRDPDKIVLPPSQNNPLAKELRKRVFHSILGICVTTGCRSGRPVPWQYNKMDVPLPMAMLDIEISEEGIRTSRSGSCDFWPCLQLAKLLPLLTEMHNHVTSVRRMEKDYVRTVEILHGKIDAWRREWDDMVRPDERSINLSVATLLVEGWAAEYMLNLYHPSLCPTRSIDVMERHLEICHKQAQRLLKSFHTLSNKYKGVDFTWHSTVAYALGFGITLHVYQQRKGRVSTTQFEYMKNEFKGWMSLMAYADLVLRTGNHLQHIFEPRVKRLELEYEGLTYELPTADQYQRHPNSTSSSAITRPPVKAEPSPHTTPVSAYPHGMNGPPSANTQNTAPMHYQQPQQSLTGHQWPAHNPYTVINGNPAPSYVPQTSGATPTYVAYTSSASQYPGVPTSLAPLLNEQSNGYMTYPPAPPTNTPHEFMLFQPTHYTDGPATMMWPLITLPPQAQEQQPMPGQPLSFGR